MFSIGSTKWEIKMFVNVVFLSGFSYASENYGHEYNIFYGCSSSKNVDIFLVTIFS